MNKNTKNIYNDIYEISNLDLQRKLWLNENNDTSFISSYAELMCSLFDDNNFDFFIDEDAPKKGISENIILLLKELRFLLNKYDDEGKEDIEIINDPRWKSIAKLASKIIQEWDV